VRPPRLILAAHGSADPRYTAVIDSLVELVASRCPDLAVGVGYLDHGPPDLRAVDTRGGVVVPLLLTSGFHVRTDLPAQAPEASITAPLAPDPRVVALLATRLCEAGWAGQRPVTLAAAGSSDPEALAEVRNTAAALASTLGVPVEAAFVGAGKPRLADGEPAAVATYLLAPGHFGDAIAACGAKIVAAPLGADILLAEIAVERYEGAAGRAG
jgi:sirohydrochlorin ferrochelatase